MAGHHLSLSLSADLWHGLLKSALPLKVAQGEVSLVGTAREVWERLDVESRVAGLLEDPNAPPRLAEMSARVRKAWERRRPDLVQRLNELVAIEGTWRLEVDEVGTDLRYGPQKVHADAFVKGVAEGTLTLLRENITRPFRVEVRLGASVALGRVRYAADRQAVIANVQDLALHLGDHAALQVVSRLLAQMVAPRVAATPAVEILRRRQLEELVGPMGQGMGAQMAVEDLQLDIDDQDMTLKVRFGFSKAPARPALEDRGGR